ncbi:hypothetical protein [Pseudoxanthomonas putridarboris]|uniref:Uncharacterized protein n=1 Tax=Pseudoxanthomonas putridarboris TaxID=752605 RepID=A0ABU9J3G0_9GAMM
MGAASHLCARAIPVNEPSRGIPPMRGADGMGAGKREAKHRLQHGYAEVGGNWPARAMMPAAPSWEKEDKRVTTS